MGRIEAQIRAECRGRIEAKLREDEVASRPLRARARHGKHRSIEFPQKRPARVAKVARATAAAGGRRLKRKRACKRVKRARPKRPSD